MAYPPIRKKGCHRHSRYVLHTPPPHICNGRTSTGNPRPVLRAQPSHATPLGESWHAHTKGKGITDRVLHVSFSLSCSRPPNFVNRPAWAAQVVAICRTPGAMECLERLQPACDSAAAHEILSAVRLCSTSHKGTKLDRRLL